MTPADQPGEDRYSEPRDLGIREILQELTLEERAALCTGATAWTTTPIDRVGLPPLTMADGPHGVRRVADPNSMAIGALPATCFPTASLVACTWDPELVGEMGRAIAREAVALGVDVVLGPGVNIKRSPLCGRNFEYYSEDPYLSGELAVAFVDGLQSEGVGASLKHFAVNNQETKRMTVSAELDERTLRELYLPAFEAVVKRARPWTVMCAYNRVNGTWCSEHHDLLTSILRAEWGFEGLVVSDWGAVHDRPRAVAAGLDLEMPGPRARRVDAVVDSIRSGQLETSALDASARRVAEAALRAQQTPKGGTLDSEDHHALARRIAASGMVLLKNDGILPLGETGHIAVIGRSAQEPHFQGGGSSHMNPARLDVPIGELARLAGDATITYSEGYPAEDGSRPDLIAEAVRAASTADVALVFVALPDWKEVEGRDRSDLELTAQQVALIQAVAQAQPRTVVVLNNGSALTMGEWIDAPAAVLEAWMMGQAGGGAIADILFGLVNPSGRLAETFPLRLEDTPAYFDFPGDGQTVRYGEGLFVGYRAYDARRQAVRFPFGFGLSYTTFEYSKLRVSDSEFEAASGLVVTVDITNTGTARGAEVVQLYVTDREATLTRPPKELKAFARVELAPAETRTVELRLDTRAFSFYHPGYGSWITEDGEFDIHIGASAEDIRLIETVMLTSSVTLPPLAGEMSTPADWLLDPRSRPAMEALLVELAAVFAPAFGEPGSEASPPSTLDDYFLQMPLRDVLEFAEALGGPDPDVALSSMVRRVEADTAE